MRFTNNKSIFGQVGTALAITAILSSASFASATVLAGSRVSKRHGRTTTIPIKSADPGGSAPRGGSGVGNSEGELRSPGASPTIAAPIQNAATLDAASTRFAGVKVRTSSSMLRDCRFDSAATRTVNQNSYFAVGKDGMNGLQAEAGFVFRLR